MKPNKKEVGLRIKEIRKKLGYSMETFGEIVSQSPRSSVNSWEKGVSIPRKDKLEKIAQLGNTTSQQILYGDFESYAQELIKTEANYTLPQEFESAMIKAIKEELPDIDIGDDTKILKLMNYMKENMNPASEEDYLEYELFNEHESIFVAFGNRKEKALAFVYTDRENEIFHFAPTPFSDMSLSRFYVFLPNPELEHYIVKELADFEMGAHPIIVVYDLEQTENKIRVAHFEYNQMDKRYEPIVDIDKIKKIGVYSPFVKELKKEERYRHS
ncbi:helix-turn-helix domain-containing protein [Carnobacterium divergens]|uniref:helix-turn-helix domain-containing protein n=1 Tax=Carnobacterium divergens TaxID=2748 RepID=UPI00107359F4|nr:helix-turn-helix transcriptional regulator [Carnobacterium divergens]TFI90732.1 transcriptional regulator [Carnobacterium divergens]